MKTKIAFFLMLLAVKASSAQSDDERNLKDQIRLNPDSSDLRDRLGDYYLEEERPQAALSEYETAVSLDPSDLYGRYGMGMCYEIKGDYGSALGAYRKALRWMPLSLYFRIGLCYHRLGDDHKALDFLKKAEGGKNSAGIHYALALSYAGTRDWSASLREINDAREADPNFTEGKEFFGDFASMEEARSLWEERESRGKWIRASLTFAVLLTLSGAVIFIFLTFKKSREEPEEEF